MTRELETLTIGNGGWVRATSGGVTAHVRVAPDPSGRLIPYEVHMADPDGLSGPALRRFPLHQVEVWVNAPRIRPSIDPRLHVPGPDLATAASYFSTTFGSQAPKHWVVDMLRPDGRKPPKPTPDRPVAPPPSEPPDAALPVPESRPFPDDFYRAVAAVYDSLVRLGDRAPAARIADTNGVAVTQVHRWVRVCRQKGFLAPPSHGKAG